MKFAWIGPELKGSLPLHQNSNLENSVIPPPILNNEKMRYLTLRFFVENYQITRNKGSYALYRIKYENVWQLPRLCLTSHTSVYCTQHSRMFEAINFDRYF